MDVALFPLDTFKTRLQSGRGFFKAGGFTGLYKGILPVITGSAPTGNIRYLHKITYIFSYKKFRILAALFFLTYEEIKAVIQPKVSGKYHIVVHMGAATIGEMVYYFSYWFYYFMYTEYCILNIFIVLHDAPVRYIFIIFIYA